MHASYIDVHRSGKNVECPALQRHNFSVDHDVHGRGCFEFDVAHRAARSERMFDMRAVIKTRQCAEQAQPADRAPADKFNEPVGWISLRRDEHRPARVLAVVERQKKSAPLVPFLIVIAAQGQRAPAQLHHVHENTVEDFVSGTISTHGKKTPVALIVSFAGKLHGVARTCRSNAVDLQPFLAQTRECRPREFRGAAATGGGVDDGEEAIHLERERNRNANFRSTKSFPNPLPNGRTAAALFSFARRSARTLRLILREAVRGKSSSSRTTPWIRL